MPIFFKPEDGWAADFIPFYWQDKYHLFYLKDYRDQVAHGEGTPWFHLGTTDLTHFVDYGEALPRGKADEQDLYVFTGCVIEKDGVFHIFYTGHNPHLRADGKPEQAVMHATSRDLIHWTKDPANPILFADPQVYEIHDWRDPFVFWNPEANEYWMLLAARHRHGPDNRRGLTALASSVDLNTWKICNPFWSPNLYFTHECPELFKMGDWWYLVYSTFSERHITHYRMSRSLAGPWLAPANDSFDGRAFYAAKTASDGHRRFAFGWDPTRTNEQDTGRWNWGGHLVVHEIIQESDGSLSVRIPPEITCKFEHGITAQIEPRLGNWVQGPESWSVHAESEFAWASVAPIPPTSIIETSITFTKQTRGVGVLLRADDQLNRYYQVRLEPGLNRVVLDRCPRPGDEAPLIERPIPLSEDRAAHVRVVVEGTMIVVYVNDQVALSARGYEHTDGNYGLFVSEGSAQFNDTHVNEFTY